MRDNTPEGAETRANLTRIAEVEQRKSNEMIGAELGYVYGGSPVIWPEPGDPPEPDFMKYVPTTWPGARLPHVWLDDGRALHDRIGDGYTLLRLAGTQADMSGLAPAFAAYGAPLTVLNGFIPDPLRRIVTREIDRHDIAVGGLTEQALLRRDANAGLGAGVVEPQLAAAFEHQLAGVTQGLDKADQAGQRRVALRGPRVAQQRAGVDLLAFFKLGQRHRDPKRLAGIAHRVAGGQHGLGVAGHRMRQHRCTKQ